MFEVIKYFTDLQDNNFVYKVGDKYPRDGATPTEGRIKELLSDKNRQKVPLIKKIADPSPDVDADAKQITSDVDADTDTDTDVDAKGAENESQQNDTDADAKQANEPKTKATSGKTAKSK